MALLDWEKAFDKIQHDKMMIALQRLGICSHIIDVIKNCYNAPTFFVKDSFGTSEIKQQKTGIRQGCPLSPYLFIMVMTCIDYDINRRSSKWVKNNRLPNLNYDMVYYADDTILFSQNTRAVNELLKHTENVSSQFGLNLNKDKCVAINMNNEGNIKFQDGKSFEQKYETKYLGNELNKEVNITHEISAKMHDVRKTWFKLSDYWKASNASKKWQLIIYDAIIRSKLLYGLETIHLTEGMQKKLNAFQIRGLRQILKMEHTHINRNNTNAKILATASAIAYPPNGHAPHRQIMKFSEFHEKRRSNLLGHLIRCENEDPLRQITFQNDSARRNIIGKKRVGKPRQNWIHQAKKHVWNNILKKAEDYTETEQQDLIIFNEGRNRRFQPGRDILQARERNKLKTCSSSYRRSSLAAPSPS